VRRLGAFGEGLVVVITVDPPLHSKVELVRVDKFLHRGVATCLCHRVSWVVAAVNLLDIHELASLVGFTHGHDVNYKALLFGGAEFNEAVVKRSRVSAYHNRSLG
jgi:hypothetical protein